jgi:hypothetical protein
LSSAGREVVRLFHTSASPSTKHPQVDIPPIDRRALMVRAHVIAKRFRPDMPGYRAALAHGLRVAWTDAKSRQEHRERFAGYVPRALTAKQIADSRAATRRCGASYMPF